MPFKIFLMHICKTYSVEAGKMVCGDCGCIANWTPSSSFLPPAGGVRKVRLRFCRRWRSDLPRGACLLVSSSVDHDAVRLEAGLQALLLTSRCLIEPIGPGRSRLTHYCRADLRQVTPQAPALSDKGNQISISPFYASNSVANLWNYCFKEHIMQKYVFEGPKTYL